MLRQCILVVQDDLFWNTYHFVVFITTHLQVFNLHEVESLANRLCWLPQFGIFRMHPLKVEDTFVQLLVLNHELGVDQLKGRPDQFFELITKCLKMIYLFLLFESLIDLRFISGVLL